MNAADFIKQRGRIEHQTHQTQAWRAKAMRGLVKRSRAELIRAGGRVIGYQLPNGQVVCVKQRFRDQAAAEVKLQTIALFEGQRFAMPQRAYFCRHCSGWHLTSQPKHAIFQDE